MLCCFQNAVASEFYLNSWRRFKRSFFLFIQCSYYLIVNHYIWLRSGRCWQRREPLNWEKAETTEKKGARQDEPWLLAPFYLTPLKRSKIFLRRCRILFRARGRRGFHPTVKKDYENNVYLKRIFISPARRRKKKLIDVIASAKHSFFLFVCVIWLLFWYMERWKRIDLARLYTQRRPKKIGNQKCRLGRSSTTG